MYALETNVYFNEYKTRVARQTSSSLHALPFLSADAEEDAVSTLRTLSACPESQGSFSVSGTNTIYPSSPASCCNKPPGQSKPIYNRITPHSSSLPLCNSLLVHSPRASESWRFPVHATWGKSGACQLLQKETARSLMIMKCEVFCCKFRQNFKMTKELSTHHRCRCQERLFLCFSPMLIFQEDDII